jgi:hypothetical protein
VQVHFWRARYTVMPRAAAISSCPGTANWRDSTTQAATESSTFSRTPYHNGVDEFGRRVRFPSKVSQNDLKYQAARPAFHGHCQVMVGQIF